VRDRIQTSLNLALGSAMASIGLTIPAIAIAMIWLPGPLLLGLGGTQTVLLALTVVVGTLTVVPGRATVLQGGVHLGLLAVFLFLAASPLTGQAATGFSGHGVAAGSNGSHPASPGPRRGVRRDDRTRGRDDGEPLTSARRPLATLLTMMVGAVHVFADKPYLVIGGEVPQEVHRGPGGGTARTRTPRSFTGPGHVIVRSNRPGRAGPG